MLTVLESTSKVEHRVGANNTDGDKMRVKTISESANNHSDAHQ